MGKKKGRKGGKVTLSLAQFTESRDAGKDPELAALPTAPKGDPARDGVGGGAGIGGGGGGVFGRRAGAGPLGLEDEGPAGELDWTRRGPLDAPAGEAPGFGAGPERDFGAVRRGPLDEAAGGGGAAAGGAARAEVDFANVRRGGPVEAEFDGFGAAGGARGETDWSKRAGPVEASFEKEARREQNWAERNGPVESAFERDAPRDWAQRRGPVEADLPALGERDWTQRKGPVEAEPVELAREPNWTARKGPIEPLEQPAPEPDWSSRRGPIEQQIGPAQPEVERQVDFGSARKGARLAELEDTLATPAERPVNEPWRRPLEEGLAATPASEPGRRHSSENGPGRFDAGRSSFGAAHLGRETDWSARRGPIDSVFKSRMKGGAEHRKSTGEEPDWAVRRGPLPEMGSNRRGPRRGTFRDTPLQEEPSETADATDSTPLAEHKDEPAASANASGVQQESPLDDMKEMKQAISEEDGWTTVRSASHGRRARNYRGSRGDSGRPRSRRGGMRVRQQSIEDGVRPAVRAAQIPGRPMTATAEQ